ncbi:MAG: DUF3899 domain-containing protein [Clostridia bacterium]|nr:DUF3899 domain-containing protein [Clostridia bacterium]
MIKELFQNTKFKRYLYSILTGVVLAVAVALNKGLTDVAAHYKLLALCDGLSVGGIALLCVAGFLYAYDNELFDGISYGVKSLFHVRRPQKFYKGMNESYSEYKERKHKEKGGYREIVFVGLSFLLLALIFLISAYSMDQVEIVTSLKDENIATDNVYAFDARAYLDGEEIEVKVYFETENNNDAGRYLERGEDGLFYTPELIRERNGVYIYCLGNDGEVIKSVLYIIIYTP